jgi:hydroxyacylglutathione hydrolase
MIVRRFFDPKLAQASWLIACPGAKAAIVIDPNRDAEQYVRAAEEERVAITHVTETHIHADFLSGARDLARGTGAQLLLSDEGDADWKYAYAAADGARLVRDGDTAMVGNVKVQVVHTPGHTPEHICFLFTDTAAASEPIGMATGDFVFVGDVGRPDLLERAAKVQGTMVSSARLLFRSLQQFRRYPDWLQIWPGHGAGSACGKGLSAVPHSTAGYEKRFNWAFAISDEETFVRAVLDGQPEPPKYFAEMKRVNKAGPAAYDPSRLPPVGDVTALGAALAAGTPVVDTRTAAAFAEGHVTGTINIPLNRSFNTYAGWLLPYDRDVALIVDGPAALREAVRDLAMVGLDRVAMAFDGDALRAWRAHGGAVGSVRTISLADLKPQFDAGAVQVIDVRGSAEWDAGHLPDVPNIPLGYLTDRLDELPRHKPIVLQCQHGGRAAIAASLLQARGYADVLIYDGGFAAWEAAGHLVE